MITISTVRDRDRVLERARRSDTFPKRLSHWEVKSRRQASAEIHVDSSSDVPFTPRTGTSAIRDTERGEPNVELLQGDFGGKVETSAVGRRNRVP